MARKPAKGKGTFKSGRYAGKKKSKNYGRRRTKEEKETFIAKRIEKFSERYTPKRKSFEGTVIRNEEATGAYRRIFLIDQDRPGVSIDQGIKQLRERVAISMGNGPPNNVVLAHFVLWVYRKPSGTDLFWPVFMNETGTEPVQHTPKNNQRLENDQDVDNFKSEILYYITQGYRVDSINWSYSL